jgi:hypothetical protein
MFYINQYNNFLFLHLGIYSKIELIIQSELLHLMYFINIYYEGIYPNLNTNFLSKNCNNRFNNHFDNIIIYIMHI